MITLLGARLAVIEYGHEYKKLVGEVSRHGHLANCDDGRCDSVFYPVPDNIILSCDDFVADNVYHTAMVFVHRSGTWENTRVYVGWVPMPDVFKAALDAAKIAET